MDSLDLSDTALVLHTSGTTSRPKIVPLTHANLLQLRPAQLATTLRLAEEDRCLNVMPLFHIHGLIGGGAVLYDRRRQRRLHAGIRRRTVLRVA